MALTNALFKVFEPYKDIIKSSEIPVKTSIITLVLYGFKAFLQEIVFNCPRDFHILYGSLFICGPAVILFCLSMLISESFWTLVTGCCRLQSRKRRLVWWKSSKSIYLSLLPPSMWLVFAFMEGDFYTCLTLGPFKVAKERITDPIALSALQDKFASAKSVSAIISWAMLISLTLIVTIAVTLSRLFAQVDPKLQGEIEFDEIEAQEAVELWNAKLKKLAKAQAHKVIQEVEKLAEDSNVAEQIRRGESYLKQLYPRYGGVVSGHYRDNNWRPREVEIVSEQEDFHDHDAASADHLLINATKLRSYGARHTTSI